jgi:hypothetical protein
MITLTNVETGRPDPWVAESSGDPEGVANSTAEARREKLVQNLESVGMTLSERVTSYSVIADYMSEGNKQKQSDILFGFLSTEVTRRTQNGTGMEARNIGQPSLGASLRSEGPASQAAPPPGPVGVK